MLTVGEAELNATLTWPHGEHTEISITLPVRLLTIGERLFH